MSRSLSDSSLIEDVVGILNGDPPRFGAAAAKLAENVADRNSAHLRARHAGNFEQRHAAAARLHLDLDLLVVELAGAELLSEASLVVALADSADQRVEHALFRRLLCARMHVFAFSVAVNAMAISTRSRTICSTSRPTYPTSVNFVASTLRNGAPASLARRRAISVLPTPVGPIIRIFFGRTSSRSRSSSCSRRQRLRNAMATARLASAWPTMKRSSSETISRGEKSVMRFVPSRRRRRLWLLPASVG